MKRFSFFLLVTFLFSCFQAKAQNYSSLWKDAEAAEQKDLPKTQLQALQQIAMKAQNEKAYGQLIKAELTMARVQATISSDSLLPAVERLRLRAEAEKDAALQAVWHAVLGKILQNWDRHGPAVTQWEGGGTDWRSIADDYFRKALAQPALLATVKANTYEPFVVKGEDSRIYDNDLLSLIGRETRQWKPLHEYYLTTDNRTAQLLSGLGMIENDCRNQQWLSTGTGREVLERIDSLIECYAELQECGEAAIKRYDFMNSMTDATAEQKVGYIDMALKRWGTWKGMNELRNYRNDMTAPQFTARLEQRLWIPNREQPIKMQNLRNIDQLTLRFYRVNADGDTPLDPDNEEDYKQLSPLLSPLPFTLKRTYTGKKDYELYDDSLTLTGLPVGVYIMEAETQPKTSVSRTLFYVSDVRVLSEMLPNNQIRYVAVNATTGEPLKGAQLRLTRRSGYRKNTLIATLTTDKDGECRYTYKKDELPQEIFVTTPTDRACPTMNGYGYFGYDDNNHRTEHFNIYTDRAIYRPGQTVHVAAIAYKLENGFEHEVLANKQLTVCLRDANYKIVEERKLVADEFGTVSTQFTLPASGLTGQFCIQVGDVVQYFRVEEYKRPTFQVEFPKMNQDYKDGDTLNVKATARSYAGVPVQGAHVKYKVQRRMAWWWLNYRRHVSWPIGTAQDNQEIFAGETVTQDDGTFEVRIPMLLPRSLHPQFYNFVVIADVTDQGGETHQAQLSLPLGNRKTALTIDLDDKVLMERTQPMKLHLLNAAGNDINATVRYQIDGGKWQQVQSNTPVELPKLKSGKHNLLAVCGEDSVQRSFVVFSLDDKRPATETNDWFYLSDDQFPNDGKPVTLQVGSSAKNVHIVYTIVSGNTIIEQGAVDRSNELLNRKLTYKPEYGNGLTLSFVWMRDGKDYHHEAQILRPLPNKQLTMKWETFRDRLTPGQQEEWTLKIEAPDDYRSPLAAQLMAVLYDKSLDQIAAHNWMMEPMTMLPLPSMHWSNVSQGSASCYGHFRVEHLHTETLQYNHFDTSCFPRYWISRRNLGSRRESVLREVTVKAKAMTQMAYADNIEQANAAIGTFDGMAQTGQEGTSLIAAKDLKRMEKSDETKAAEVQLRENLQETAFFYPQLTANEEGKVSLKFTLPESLTTWRFMGLAHTKDMRHGYIDGEAVAQKDVMIQPNMPRFVRVGDKATISARLFNTTEREQTGTACLQLLDPESGNVILDEQMTFSLRANGTDNVTFDIDCEKLSEHSLLVCKMLAYSDSFSDGEQHYLPVLPNHERVTVTVPFTQTNPGTKKIDLQQLHPSNLSSPKMTVEYTNNPAWLPLLALPTVGHPHDNCAICQATSYYANCIGRHIIQQNPQTKHVFETWKREEATGNSSLGSSLSKNEELKDLVLAETPWVMDADREAEQKHRLSEFFDQNLMDARLSSAVDKLTKLQNADGSWSWWEGMRGSFFMTVEISEMLVRLQQMTGEQQNTKTMLQKAFSFMDAEIVQLVAEMKKDEKKGHRQVFPTFKALQYLYLSKLDGRKHSKSVADAQTYLKALLKKDIKHQTIYEKALSAIILDAPSYIKSLKEYTVYKEDMGRYYDTQRASYSWRDYRIPTQVAAIEAFQRLTPTDTVTIDEMRRWLLQQKRTQAWDTPINSADAIYALLNKNSKALVPASNTILRVDGKGMDTSQATAGIGYVKSVLAMPSGSSLPKEFSAEKTSTGTSWGAVYLQFSQPTASIADQQSEISVKREVILPDGTRLQGNTAMLKVGSRVKVRLMIQTTRDLDFVEVIDKRAACMEPVAQLSGYRNGAYCAPKDNATHYFFDMLSKGQHVLETEYYIDRAGSYETGTCTVQCAYAPEFRGTTHSERLQVEPK